MPNNNSSSNSSSISSNISNQNINNSHFDIETINVPVYKPISFNTLQSKLISKRAELKAIELQKFFNDFFNKKEPPTTALETIDLFLNSLLFFSFINKFYLTNYSNIEMRFLFINFINYFNSFILSNLNQTTFQQFLNSIDKLYTHYTPVYLDIHNIKNQSGGSNQTNFNNPQIVQPKIYSARNPFFFEGNGNQSIFDYYQNLTQINNPAIATNVFQYLSFLFTMKIPFWKEFMNQPNFYSEMVKSIQEPSPQNINLDYTFTFFKLFKLNVFISSIRINYNNHETINLLNQIIQFFQTNNNSNQNKIGSLLFKKRKNIKQRPSIKKEFNNKFPNVSYELFINLENDTFNPEIIFEYLIFKTIQNKKTPSIKNPFFEILLIENKNKNIFANYKFIIQQFFTDFQKIKKNNNHFLFYNQLLDYSIPTPLEGIMFNQDVLDISPFINEITAENKYNNFISFFNQLTSKIK